MFCIEHPNQPIIITYNNKICNNDNNYNTFLTHKMFLIDFRSKEMII